MELLLFLKRSNCGWFLYPLVLPSRTFLAKSPSRHNATRPLVSRYAGCIDHNLIVCCRLSSFCYCVMGMSSKDKAPMVYAVPSTTCMMVVLCINSCALPTHVNTSVIVLKVLRTRISSLMQHRSSPLIISAIIIHCFSPC
jgi:hypothetical protein